VQTVLEVSREVLLGGIFEQLDCFENGELRRRFGKGLEIRVLGKQRARFEVRADGGVELVSGRANRVPGHSQTWRDYNSRARALSLALLLYRGTWKERNARSAVKLSCSGQVVAVHRREDIFVLRV
jgi:hypothetical protein